MTNSITIWQRKNNNIASSFKQINTSNWSIEIRNPLEEIIKDSWKILAKTSEKKSYLSEQAWYIIELMLAKIFWLSDEKITKLKAWYNL